MAQKKEQPTHKQYSYILAPGGATIQATQILFPVDLIKGCSFVHTKKVRINQPVYHCATCFSNASHCVCFYCAATCHANHKLVIPVITFDELVGFCDCACTGEKLLTTTSSITAIASELKSSGVRGVQPTIVHRPIDYEKLHPEQILAQLIANFGAAILQQMAEQEAIQCSPPTNTVIAPYSIYRVLFNILLGSSGETRSQLESVLMDKKLCNEKVDSNVKLLVNILTQVSDKVAVYPQFSEANLIVSRVELNSNFQLQVHLSKCEIVDICQCDSGDGFTQAIVKHLNDWITESTRKQIKGFVTDEMVRNAKLFLMNACYFKGDTRTYSP